MLIVMKSGATEEEISRVATVVQEMDSGLTSCRARPAPPSVSPAIREAIDPVHPRICVGVAEAIRVSKPHKLVTLDLRPEKTVVAVGEAKIGGDDLAIIAGPCAVENREKAFCDCRSCSSKRRQVLPRRRFQAGAFPVRISRAWAMKVGKSCPKCGTIYGLKIVAEASTNTVWTWPKSMPT